MPELFTSSAPAATHSLPVYLFKRSGVELVSSHSIFVYNVVGAVLLR